MPIIKIWDGTEWVEAGIGNDVVTLAGTQTLTNKTLTAPNIGAATGTSLNVSGNVTSTGGTLSGTAVTSSGPITTSTGTVSGTVLSSTGNTTVGANLTVTGTVSAAALGGTLLSSSTPTSVSGSGTAGTSVIPARSDHQHGTSGLITTSTVAAGDVSGSFSALALGTTGVTAGTYTKVTVDTKGRVTTATTAALSDLSVPSSDINLNSKKITNLGTPTLSTDAANKAYVDTYITGLDFKPSVRVATTGSVSISSAPATIDGVTLVSGNRVLVKDQTATSDPANGIYVFNGAGSAMTRAADVDEPFEITSGLFTFVEEGTANANSGWTLITDTSPVSVGTTSIQFSQFAASPLLATSAPASLSGTASVGTGTSAARSDHQHGTAGVGLTSGKLSQFSSTTSSELAGVISDETGTGALVFATGGTLVTPNLGTPSAAFLNNATQLPIGTGVSGLAANVATFLGTPSSANLLSAITTETGTGTVVFNISPTLVTPNLGTPSAINLTNATGLPNSATSGTSTATANTLVLRDANTNFAAGTVTAALIGNATSATSATTAAALSSLRNFILTGDVAGTQSSDLTSGVSVASTLGTTGVTAGAYTNANITVDAKGRITVASSGAAVTGTVSASLINLLGSTSGTTALVTNAIAGLGTVLVPSGAGTVATLVGTQTFVNKTINLGTNTLTSTFTQLNTAVSDATLVSTTGTETLTNKTITSGTVTTPVITFSTSAAVTAGTNAQGQGALTSDYNVVTTAAANPSGVTLPTATLGRRVIVVNKGANPVNVYPATGGTIDALTINTSIQVPVAGIMQFNASSTTQWYSSASTTLVAPLITNANLIATTESINIVASAVTAATINVDVLTASVWYYTGTASANAGTVNFRGNAATTLSSLIGVGESLTAVFMQTNGTTAYKPALFQIDGTTFTPKWQGGTVTTGNASAIDAYTFTIIKTAATPTYTVLGAQTKYV